MSIIHPNTIRWPEPFVREAGASPAVLCLHCNASSSSQWRPLMDRLSPDFHVLATDAYDAGESPRWPWPDYIRLEDEVALLEPVLAKTSGKVMLVGHSYGAAVAIKLALTHRDRVAALALYEPTLFSLVEKEQPRPNDIEGIRRAIIEAGLALDFGDPQSAARVFIDYWGGEGSFDAMPPARQAPIVKAIVNIRRWGHALTLEPTPIRALHTLTMPVLLMVGDQTRAPAKAVAELLMRELPKPGLRVFEGAGHMGPVTHPDLVNQEIADFLRHCAPPVTARAA